MPSLATASKYNRAALRVAVAQICQSLGWQSASSMALDVLVDVMQNHLQELAKLTGRYANQFDRTLANLDDLGLALRDLGVPATDLEDYMYTVEPTSFPHRVPRLPVPRPTNLSFLKPGSQEIVTRPIHVYEHLPPMHPDTAEDEGGDSQPADSSGGRMAAGSASSPGLKRPGDSLASEAKRGRFLPEEEGRPMREILSVMMTTSGFISPAREGKLPETRLPEPLDDYGDDYRHVKTRKQRADTYRRLSERENERRNRDRERERDRWLREDDLFDIIDVKVEEEEGSAGSSPEKLPTATESAKLKPFKKHVKTEPGSGRSAGGELPPPVVSPRGRMGEEKAKINKIKKKKPKPADVKSSKLSIFKKKIAKKKLDKSAVKLEKSAVKPEKSAVKLDKSAEKPSTSTEKPPSTLTEKPPSTSTEKPPSTSTEKPSTSTEKPSTSTEKPSTSTGKPSTSTGKPKTSAVPPVKKRPKKKLPPMLPDEPQLFSSPAKPIEVAPSKPADPPAAKAKGADKTSKSADKTTSKSADRAPAKHAERTPTKAAQRPAPKPAVKAERVAARPRSPSPPVVSTSSLTPPGTPGTPRAPEPRRKPSEVSLSDLSPRSDDSGTPDRPRTPELQVRREPPPPPPDPAALLNNPLIPRFPFPFAVGAGPEGVPPPPFPGLPGLRPPPSLFLNTPPAAAAAAKARAKSPEERREKPRPLAARLLDPRRSPSDASDGSRSPTPDLGAMTPLKRLEMAERAEKKKEKEHKKNKKDKKEKKKKDKKDKDKKELKTDKKEKKKKEEKDTPPAKVQDDRDETVPKLTLRLASQDSPDSRSPSPEPPPPKLVIKPVREQPEPSTSAPVGRPKKKPGKKKAEEPPPALLKPPKKEKEKKKSPVVKPKKTVSPPKAQPAAVIAETVGSFLDSEGNRIWICPECGRQDDGSPMIGCDGCDDWYHWVCVGIQVPPGDEDWFCPRCIVKMQSNVKQKGKGRGKKK